MEQILPGEHRLLPYCWVCQRRFFGKGGSSEVIEHVHHIVPQAAGGAEGPTVSLCTHHHDLLHRIAEAWMSKIPSTRSNGDALLKAEKPQYQMKIRWLATVVVRSLQAVANDPNKLSRVLLTLSAEDARKLADLQKVANITNKPDTLKKLIRDAHARFFPVSR